MEVGLNLGPFLTGFFAFRVFVFRAGVHFGIFRKQEEVTYESYWYRLSFGDEGEMRKYEIRNCLLETASYYAHE